MPEFDTCLDAIRFHPVIGPRLGKDVGSVIGMSQLHAEIVPDQVLSSMLSRSDELRFDDELFDQAADDLVGWLTREHETVTALAPLSQFGVAFDAGTPVQLEPRVEIDGMTDDEVIDCLTVGLVTEGDIGSASGGYALGYPRPAVRIREQLELRIAEPQSPTLTAKVLAGGGRTEATDQAQKLVDRWGEVVETVLQALRLFKAGTVSSPGLIVRSEYLQYPPVRGGRFVPLSSSMPYRSGESYRLEAGEEGALVELWTQLREPQTTKRKPLSTAIRRFGIAGERSRAEDQIIDLMIAAEAVFLPSEQGESIHKLSLRSALLIDLIGDARPAREIATIMRRAYNARSRLAHGAEAPDLKLPDGSAATLPQYVDLVSGYMRVALRQLVEWVAAGDPAPLDAEAWDEFTFERLSSSDA